MSTDTERAAFEMWKSDWLAKHTAWPTGWDVWQARAAIAQQPEAWGVENEEGAMSMVFLDKAEAATYCDGAEPVALGRIGGAAIAQPAEPSEVDRLNAERLDLALLVQRLIRRMRAAREGKGIKLGDDAMEQAAIGYLKRKGLIGSPFRAEGDEAQADAQPVAPTARQPLHVGDSSFEDWFAQYDPASKGDKQRARDAYAAGMSDPLAGGITQEGE
jgi:hypothetical protein